MTSLKQIQTDSNWGIEAPKLNENFNAIGVELATLKNTTSVNVPLFSSVSEAKGSIPYPNVGKIVLIGSTLPAPVYRWNGTDWIDTGITGGDTDVSLTNYYNKTEVDNQFAEVEKEAVKKTTELNISVLYPTLGVNGTNKYTLEGAITQVPQEYRTMVGFKITFINDETSLTETWTYNGDTFTDATNWMKAGGSGSNMILEWNTDINTTRKQVLLSNRKAGMQISYLDPANGWVNEQFIGSEFDDESWCFETNWMKFLSEKTSVLTIEGSESYNKPYYLLQDGRMLKGNVSSQWGVEHSTKDFYKVNKGDVIEVVSFSQYDKSIIAFYSEKSEDAYIESVLAINADDASNSRRAYINKASYIANSGGYVRIYSLYAKDSSMDINTIVSLDGNNLMMVPTVIIGKNGELDNFNNMLYNNTDNNTLLESEGYDNSIFVPKFYLANKGVGLDSTSADDCMSKFIKVNKGDKVTVYTNNNRDSNSFLFYSADKNFECEYAVDGNADITIPIEYTVNSNGLIQVFYNIADGQWTNKGVYNGKTLPYIKIERENSGGGDKNETKPVTNITELEGVEDYSLENLFDKTNIRTYDSEFADKVFEAIGRKTDSGYCYSNNILCKKGDWFTRSDFGTGIVVVLDGNENILGDIKNAAYAPTIQIAESEGQDFTNAIYVVMVVPLANIDTEKIVKAKYLPPQQGDYFKMPTFRLDQLNIPNGLEYPVKSTSGRFYNIIVDDSGEQPMLKLILQEGIPMAELPQNFPLFSLTGDFSKYYDYLILCPIEGGVTNYLYQLSSSGLVVRYINKKVNCPRILKEDDTWYFYGVDGSLNTSSGKLNIYKADGETFELVKGPLGNSREESIEPHDCLVLSVNPLHYICQRYVSNQTTIVDGVSKVVTALHLEEVYEGTSVWEWHSEDYPELWTDSHYQGNNADYLHNNTICIGLDGNLYLNNKQANQILVLKRTWDEEAHTGTIGKILWKIGGNSTHSGWDVPTRIKTTAEQQWYESHDAIVNSDGSITMFDNGNTGASRILDFSIDTVSKVLTNFKGYTYNGYKGRYMGSTDRAASGVYLVSWGSSRTGNTANAGLYDFNTGKALFEIRFNTTGSSAYRIYGIKKGQ